MTHRCILVTGGLGYIGSHTVVELITAGYTVVIADDLSNSEAFVLDRIERICGVRPAFHQINVCDKHALQQLPSDISGVIHFAAFKSVGESVSEPLKYYHNNLNSLESILGFCAERNITDVVFSSSCTVYGQPSQLPVTEDMPFGEAWSPYGFTKQIGEKMLRDFLQSGATQKVVSLRYFNPAGAHESGLIGELPRGIPNNLMPYITQTAAGLRDKLKVFGSDYQTPDGSAIRDYIHVCDLARAHVKAIEYCEHISPGNSDVFNLGNGQGISVLQVIESFEFTSRMKLPWEFAPRRPGDVEQIWADTQKAARILGFTPQRSIDDITLSAWNWEQKFRSQSQK